MIDKKRPPRWVHPVDFPQELRNEVAKELHNLLFIKELTDDQRSAVGISMSCVLMEGVPLNDKWIEKVPKRKRFRK